MKIINLVALLLSLIGVLLTSTRYISFLQPTDMDPQKEHTPRVSAMWGGTDVEETLDQYIERRHEYSTSRVGSIFVLLSIIVQQVPVSGKITYSHWWLFAILLFAILLLAGLLAWEVSEHWVDKIRNEAKAKKDSWKRKLE